MRTLHLIRDLEHGGDATQLRLLLSELVARGHAPEVATLRYPGSVAQRLHRSGVPVHWLARRWRFDLLTAVRLTRLRRAKRFVLFQSWDDDSSVWARAAARRSRARWAHTVRAPLVGCPPSEPDVFVTPDKSVAETVRAAGVDSGAIAIVPNAVDPGLQRADASARAAARARLRSTGCDTPDGAPVVTLVTRMEDSETARELAWAADLLRVVQPGLRLLVVGDGPGRLPAKRFADGATEPGLVRWLGPLDDTRDVLAAADVVWCGGLAAESTPMLSAAAVGRPIVCLDAPGRERLVGDVPGEPAAGEPRLAPCRLPLLDRAGWARATDRLLRSPSAAAARVEAATGIVAERTPTAAADAYERMLATLND